MMLAPVGALGGTMGRAVGQQASASCCKGVHPYTYFFSHLLICLYATHLPNLSADVVGIPLSLILPFSASIYNLSHALSPYCYWYKYFVTLLYLSHLLTICSYAAQLILLTYLFVFLPSLPYCTCQLVL